MYTLLGIIALIWAAPVIIPLLVTLAALVYLIFHLALDLLDRVLSI
jgi:hypothetical protein